MRIPISEVKNSDGKELEFSGWVHARRDHGKIIFIDLRDRSGLVQVVFSSGGGSASGGTPSLDNAKDLRLEYVVKITGLVKARPASMVSEGQPNGAFELEAKTLKILNEAEATLSVDTDGYEINEGSRMLHRYVDLRRERLQKNLAMRHHVIKAIRDYLDKKGFYEIETPILTKSTPEGARDYLVPSRIYPGNFYALPQSPQQYKQLLMVAGVEKYFQIARCFRDEDTRGDRQPEFTQLDLEMSFVEREDVMAINEALLIELVEKLYPEKRIQEKPFPVLTYAEAMKKYKTDRPDLREDKNNQNLLAFCWITDFPFFERVAEGNEAHPELAERVKSGSTGSPQTSKEVWTFTHNPFSAPKTEKDMENLLAKKNIESILTSQYDIVLNGWEIGGGSIRNHKSDALTAVINIIGVTNNDVFHFKHMFDALDSGAPPHGGIAWGLDRLMMILQNEPNIREVIAFPKTGDGRDLMMNAPSEVDEKQLDELGLEIKKKKK
jgi:aspartyl-tRNA synthetase